MKNKKTEGKISVIVAIVLLFAITVLSMSYIVCKDIDQPANIQITITDTRPELNSHGKEQFVFTPQNFNDPNDVERMTLKIERLVSDSWEQKSDGFTYKIQAVIAVTAIFFTLLVVVVSLFQYLKTKQFDSEFKELKNEIDKLNDIKDKFDDQKKLTDKIIEFNVKTAQYSEATSHYLEGLNDKDLDKAVQYYTESIKTLNEITKIKKLEKYIEDIDDKNKNMEAKVKNLKYRGYNNRGSMKLVIGNEKEALLDFNKAIELNPNALKTYSNRGNLKIDIGDIEGALADYNKAIQINPNYAEVYYNRGNLKVNIRDIKGALADYNKTIELNSKYTFAYFNRGNLKRDIGDIEGALADYNKTIELFESEPNIYYLEKAKNLKDKLEKEMNK